MKTNNNNVKTAVYKTYRRPYHRKALAPHHYSHGGSSHYFPPQLCNKNV